MGWLRKFWSKLGRSAEKAGLDALDEGADAAAEAGSAHTGVVGNLAIGAARKTVRNMTAEERKRMEGGSK